MIHIIYRNDWENLDKWERHFLIIEKVINQLQKPKDAATQEYPQLKNSANQLRGPTEVWAMNESLSIESSFGSLSTPNGCNLWCLPSERTVARSTVPPPIVAVPDLPSSLEKPCEKLLPWSLSHADGCSTFTEFDFPVSDLEGLAPEEELDEDSNEEEFTVSDTEDLDEPQTTPTKASSFKLSMIEQPVPLLKSRESFEGGDSDVSSPLIKYNTVQAQSTVKAASVNAMTGQEHSTSVLSPRPVVYTASCRIVLFVGSMVWVNIVLISFSTCHLSTESLDPQANASDEGFQCSKINLEWENLHDNKAIEDFLMFLISQNNQVHVKLITNVCPARLKHDVSAKREQDTNNTHTQSMCSVQFITDKLVCPAGMQPAPRTCLLKDCNLPEPPVCNAKDDPSDLKQTNDTVLNCFGSRPIEQKLNSSLIFSKHKEGQSSSNVSENTAQPPATRLSPIGAYGSVWNFWKSLFVLILFLVGGCRAEPDRFDDSSNLFNSYELVFAVVLMVLFALFILGLVWSYIFPEEGCDTTPANTTSANGDGQCTDHTAASSYDSSIERVRIRDGTEPRDNPTFADELSSFVLYASLFLFIPLLMALYLVLSVCWRISCRLSQSWTSHDKTVSKSSPDKQSHDNAASSTNTSTSSWQNVEAYSHRSEVDTEMVYQESKQNELHSDSDCEQAPTVTSCPVDCLSSEQAASTGVFTADQNSDSLSSEETVCSDSSTHAVADDPLAPNEECSQQGLKPHTTHHNSSTLSTPSSKEGCTSNDAEKTSDSELTVTISTDPLPMEPAPSLAQDQPSVSSDIQHVTAGPPSHCQEDASPPTAVPPSSAHMGSGDELSKPTLESGLGSAHDHQAVVVTCNNSHHSNHTIQEVEEPDPSLEELSSVSTGFGPPPPGSLATAGGGRMPLTYINLHNSREPSVAGSMSYQAHFEVASLSSQVDGRLITLKSSAKQSSTAPEQSNKRTNPETTSVSSSAFIVAPSPPKASPDASQLSQSRLEPLDSCTVATLPKARRDSCASNEDKSLPPSVESTSDDANGECVKTHKNPYSIPSSESSESHLDSPKLHPGCLDSAETKSQDGLASNQEHNSTPNHPYPSPSSESSGKNHLESTKLHSDSLDNPEKKPSDDIASNQEQDSAHEHLPSPTQECTPENSDTVYPSQEDFSSQSFSTTNDHLNRDEALSDDHCNSSELPETHSALSMSSNFTPPSSGKDSDELELKSTNHSISSSLDYNPVLPTNGSFAGASSDNNSERVDTPPSSETNTGGPGPPDSSTTKQFGGSRPSLSDHTTGYNLGPGPPFSETKQFDPGQELNPNTESGGDSEVDEPSTADESHTKEEASQGSSRIRQDTGSDMKSWPIIIPPKIEPQAISRKERVSGSDCHERDVPQHIASKHQASETEDDTLLSSANHGNSDTGLPQSVDGGATDAHKSVTGGADVVDFLDGVGGAGVVSGVSVIGGASVVGGAGVVGGASVAGGASVVGGAGLVNGAAETGGASEAGRTGSDDEYDSLNAYFPSPYTDQANDGSGVIVSGDINSSAEHHTEEAYTPPVNVGASGYDPAQAGSVMSLDSNEVLSHSPSNESFVTKEQGQPSFSADDLPQNAIAEHAQLVQDGHLEPPLSTVTTVSHNLGTSNQSASNSLTEYAQPSLMLVEDYSAPVQEVFNAPLPFIQEAAPPPFQVLGKAIVF